jgi:uncharacterized protein (TIGR02145 family)
MIPSLAESPVYMSDDTVLEKYCYGDSEANCQSEGPLYAWAEMMYLPDACNGSTSTVCAPSAYLNGTGATARRQGICPKGWHIPSDYEFTVLENFLDSNVALSANPDYYADQIGNSGTINWRGTDVGTKLKAGGSSHLNLPLAGYLLVGGPLFTNHGSRAYLWTSTQASNLYSINRLTGTGGNAGQVYRNYYYKNDRAQSVRCLKD